jgi:hypothetical protein
MAIALFLAAFGHFLPERRTSIFPVSAFVLVRTAIPCISVFSSTVIRRLAAFVRQRRARHAVISVASTAFMISITSVAFDAD